MFQRKHLRYSDCPVISDFLDSPQCHHVIIRSVEGKRFNAAHNRRAFPEGLTPSQTLEAWTKILMQCSPPHHTTSTVLDCKPYAKSFLLFIREKKKRQISNQMKWKLWHYEESILRLIWNQYKKRLSNTTVVNQECAWLIC